MKLVHPDFFCQIELPEDRIPILILENPTCFLKAVSDLICLSKGKEGKWILSDAGKPLNFAKTCDVLIDPFSLEINQKRLINSLYEKLEKEVINSELILEWNAIYPHLANIVEKILNTSDHHLIYCNEIEIKDFFKFMNIQFCDSSENLIEKIIDYMALAADVLGIRLFVLINFKTYIDPTGLYYLYEQAIYRKYRLLLIESHFENEDNNLEKTIIIDKDNCLIY